MPFSTKTSLHGIRRSPALEKQAELKKTQNVINQNFKTNRRDGLSKIPAASHIEDPATATGRQHAQPQKSGLI